MSYFAGEAAERVSAVAKNVLDAAAQEARQQGLTLEGAKSAAGDISAKVGRIAETAGNSIAERAKISR